MRHARSETFILDIEKMAKGDALTAEAKPTQATRRISSKDLLGDARTVVIEHEGADYTLRLTRLGKLLLTK